MAIEFDCPACDATIRVKDDAAGKKGRCPKCRVLLLVPEPEAEPEPEDDEASSAEQESVSVPPLAVPVALPKNEAPAPPTPAQVAAPIGSAEKPPEPPAATTPIDPPPPVEEPVEENLEVVSTPNPTPLPVVPDSPTSRVARSGRKSSVRRSSKGIWSAAVAVIAFLMLAGGAWFAYQASLPDVPDIITGERYRNFGLPPARFPAPSSDAIGEDVRASVMKSFASEGLPLKSGFVEVWLNAEGDEITVSVEPGPRSSAVRVPLGELASIRSMLSRDRDRIASVKSRELRRSTGDMFHDYAAYLENGTAMSRLPEYRDEVALNAATGVTGYAVEAIVGSTPFLCVYEDSTGGCYFFPPKETRKFKIRGRKLADGTTPLPIEVDVVVKDAEGAPPSAADETEQPGPEESEKKENAESKDDEASSAPDEATDPAMPEPSDEAKG